KPIVLSVDASSFGIGGVLLQKGQPVAYTSATLSEAQTRYSQIEKELLAIVHACEHFHYYVFGQHVEIETDHKPLLGIIHKPFENISPRLQRLLLRLQRYSFKLIHVPGKYLAVADPVSTSDIDNAQLMVSLLVQASKSKLDEILLETKNDIELQSVANYIENDGLKEKV
ncbi:Retrovirus-related Pol polyprotein from transposon 17.6, partial [Araneus ventricosus]